MVNRAARRAPAEKKAPVLKLTAEGRRHHNMSIAKRSSLFFISTVCALLKRKDPNYEMKPIGLSVLDTRSVFGTWNQTFPTHLRLTNLHATMMARVEDGDLTLESVAVMSFARIARIIARAATPEGAAAEIVTLQDTILEDVAPFFADDKEFPKFRTDRGSGLNELLHKLR